MKKKKKLFEPIRRGAPSLPFDFTKDKENARIFQKKKELAVARQALAAIKNKLQK